MIAHRREQIIRRIIQGLVILVIFLMAIGNIAPENDIYWQLKIGESIVKYHHFPTTDPYNLTNPNAVWTLEEWIAEVIFYILQVNFGWGALILLKAFIVALTFFFLLLLLNKLKVNLYVSLLAFFLAAMVNTRGYWTVFPSIFEYLFVVFTLYLMERYRSGKFRYLPLFIPVFSLIWANTHASFFLLEGITFSYVIGSLIINYMRKRRHDYSPVGGQLDNSQIKQITIASLVGLLMPFFSPNTYNTWLYPFIISGSKFSTSYVNEYISFSSYIHYFNESFLVSYSLILLAGVLFFWLYSRKEINPIDVILFAVFSYLGYRAFRHLAIYALVALPIFCRYASVWFREYRGWLARSLVKDILVVGLIFIFIFWYKTKQVPFGLGIVMNDFPVKAAEFVMNNKIAPNMFNHYNYGGFLIWKMPDYKVFIDGRLEMYLGQAGQDYLTLVGALSGWEKIVDKYDINFVLNYASTPLTRVFLDSQDWRLVYFDPQYVVFVKNSKKNETVIKNYYSEEVAREYRRQFLTLAAKHTGEEYHIQATGEMREGKIKDAINSFKLAVMADPLNINYLFNLAETYIKSGRYIDALEAYKLALVVDPHSQLAINRIEKLTAIISLK